MDPLAIVFGVVLLGAAMLLILRPLRVGSRPTSKAAGAGIHPGEARLAALSALRDLDFDFRTGKLSEDDYPALRAGLLATAAENLQAEEAEDHRLESLIRARRMAGAHAKPCPRCGEHVAADVHFCPHCGTALASACPSCGRIIQTGDSFCSSCGVKLEVRDQVAA